MATVFVDGGFSWRGFVNLFRGTSAKSFSVEGISLLCLFLAIFTPACL